MLSNFAILSINYVLNLVHLYFVVITTPQAQPANAGNSSMAYATDPPPLYKQLLDFMIEQKSQICVEIFNRSGTILL